MVHPRIKHMVKVMHKKERASKKAKKEWYVYILRCVDKTFYTGVTKDLQNRLKMHNTGKASRYTRTRTPVKLVYQEGKYTWSEALMRECKVKTLPRAKKKDLITQQNSI